MNTFSLLFQVVIAFVAVNCQQQYVPQQYVGPYDQVSQQQQSNGASSSSASASASSSSQNSQYGSAGNLVSGPVAGPIVGPAYGPAGVEYPYTAVDPNAQTSYASEAYHSNKGEILIHRPAPIIVKRPPTRVLVNHPPLVVKPAPVVLHKPPPVVVRKVYVKQHPRPVKVEPVYVNVVKPPAEKYYVNEKAPQAGIAYPQYSAQPGCAISSNSALQVPPQVIAQQPY